MRLIFLGTPSFALPSLDALLAAGHDVRLVVTQPDRPAGRGQHLRPPPVARRARECGLELWQTPSLNGEAAEERLRAVSADAMALAAFAALVPAPILSLAPHGILNVHPSLLPRWRGAAPIQAALLAGDHETGVSIMRLERALDAGPILLQERVPILPQDDYLTLEPHLASLGARLLVRALEGVERGTLAERPQDAERATYSRKLERQDGRIDWAAPAEATWRRVRAYRGWPGAWTTWDGALLKVLAAWPVERSGDAPPGLVVVEGGQLTVSTGDGRLQLDEVALEGRRPQSGPELLRGYPRLAGARLGS